MARCSHGFERSVIPCGICDGADKRKNATRGKLPTGETYNFVDMTGTSIAGVQVIERAPSVCGNARWRCICACGDRFLEEGGRLRRMQKTDRVASCETCKPLHRKRKASLGIPNPNLKFRPIPAEHAEPVPVLRELPAQIALRWWRLELDAKGSVLSCTAVEHRGEAGERQFVYVEAHDQKEAGRLAWNAYCRLAQIRHRAKMTREGKCPWCGRDQDRKPGRRCSTCLANDRDRAAKSKARKAGEDVAAPDALITRAARLATERAEYRITVLREVRSEAMDRNPREFQQWLDEQIDGVASGQVTAKRVAG